MVVEVSFFSRYIFYKRSDPVLSNSNNKSYWAAAYIIFVIYFNVCERELPVENRFLKNKLFGISTKTLLHP